MKLNQLVLRVAAVAVVGMSRPTSAQAQLWYNGDINGVNALSSERNTVVSQSMAYDNFVVTGAGWTINSVFGNFLANFAWSTADYEIRTGVSVGNGGTVVASGSGFAASQVATGNTAFGFTEYTATISWWRSRAATCARWPRSSPKSWPPFRECCPPPPTSCSAPTRNRGF